MMESTPILSAISIVSLVAWDRGILIKKGNEDEYY